MPRDDRCLGLEEAGIRQNRVMFSSTAYFGPPKATIRSRKGKGNKLLGSPPEREPPHGLWLEEALAGQFWGPWGGGSSLSSQIWSKGTAALGAFQ